MPRFIHIGFNFNGPILTTALEPAMMQLGDWIRYSASCWIVWTNYQPHVIADHIKNYVGPNDHYLVVALDMTAHQGWMPKWVWDWINDKLYPGFSALANTTPDPFGPLTSGLINSAPNPPAPPRPTGLLGGLFQPPNKRR
jgi:hypothetical protein